MEREKGRDLARGFIAIGLVLSGWALFLVYDIQSFVDRAVLARGQVIAIQSYAQVEGASTFQPRNTPRETVDVLYDKTNSADARIASYLYRLTTSWVESRRCCSSGERAC